MQWYSNIWTPRSFVIIFLQFNGSECTLSAMKYKVKEVSQGKIPSPQHFDSLEEVLKNYGKSIPYHIHVSGSGVLSRKIESLSNYRDELIINGNPDDFVFCSYDDESTIAASFFRRSLVENPLEFAESHKLHLLGLTAGYVPLFTLGEDLAFSLDFSLIKETGKIRSFERLEKGKDKVLHAGEYLSGQQLLVMAICQKYRQPDEHLTSSEDEAYTKALENYAQYSQFKTFGVSLLTAILLSLVINYFYMNRLNSQIAQLELDISVGNESLALLNRLEDEKSRKEQLVLSAGVNSSRFLAYYLDEIGRTVPEKIYLQEMHVFPLEGKLKNKYKVEVNKEVIRISGNTPGNEVLDDWIERMDRFEWVAGIELMNYLKSEGDRADFILMITLNH